MDIYTVAMNDNNKTQADSSEEKKSNTFKWGCLGLLGLLVIIIATVFITLWWVKRGHNIDATELTAPEELVLEKKIELLEKAHGDDPLADMEKQELLGGLMFTEKEVNSVISDDPDFKDRVYLDFKNDAIAVKINFVIPEDFPFMAGRTIKGKLDLGMLLEGEDLQVRLKNASVMGISLNNTLLGDLKDKDLVGEFFAGDDFIARLLKDIKEFKVTPEGLRIVPSKIDEETL